jgi:hypothetical protein
VKRPWRAHLRRSLGVALINNAVCFVAVIVAAASQRPDLGALVTAGIAAPLLVVALFHAFADLAAADRQPQALVQGWVALFLSFAPALLIVIFLFSTSPSARATLTGLFHLSR